MPIIVSTSRDFLINKYICDVMTETWLARGKQISSFHVRSIDLYNIRELCHYYYMSFCTITIANVDAKHQSINQSINQSYTITKLRNIRCLISLKCKVEMLLVKQKVSKGYLETVIWKKNKEYKYSIFSIL